MGTGGPPGNFDIHNLFKNSFQPGYNPAPTSYPPSPSHNFPPSNPYPPNTGSYSNLAASYPFPFQGPSYHQYPPYPQDQGARAPSYPHHNFNQPGFNQPPPSPPPPSFPVPGPPHASLPQSSLSASPSLDSARLMALLTTHSASTSLEFPTSSSSTRDTNSDISQPPAAVAPAVPSAPPVSLALPPTSGRAINSKIPRGRHLKGEHVIYDIDVRQPGESQPQLEVSPITMYSSDPVLVVGRQIAVNKSYICYGLRPNRHIRILHMTTALRNLLRGHSQRVTDMSFFAEDVHLLASASSDGRVFVRKIIEGPGEDNKLQIVDQVLLAIHFTGDWESVHPRVCWYSDTQDVVVVGISNCVLTIDMYKVRQKFAPSGFTTEEPVFCSLDNPIEGVNVIGRYDGEVTDLSTCQGARLVSGAKDGTTRVWLEHNMVSTFTPHDGQQVGAVAFLSPPQRPDHIVLLSAGPLNRELKLWVSNEGDGWFSQSESSVNWKCIQTLELRSSSEGQPEDAFFNQVLIVPKACLILLANARKNAIYIVHVDFGSNPLATRMDYLTEFSVAMPILSLTATSENVFDGDGVVQIYCVQTQAIQQHSLDMSLCLPPIGEASTFSMERDSLPGQQVPDAVNSPSHNVASGPAYEVNAILRSKSPGPISGVSLADKPLAAIKAPPFGSSEESTISGGEKSPRSTMEEASTFDARPVIGLLKKDSPTRELAPNISQIVAPTPHIGVPLSPRGSPLARARPRSPIDASLVTSPRDQTDYFRTYEQPGEKKNDGRSLLLPDVSASEAFPLSPRRISDELLTSDQQNTAGSMHLITPSELMSMVARAKAEVDGGLAVPSPKAAGVIPRELSITTENILEKQDLEVLEVETKQVTDSSNTHLEDQRNERESTLQRGVLVVEEAQTSTSFECPVDEVKEEDVDQVLMGDEAQQADENGPLEERDLFYNATVLEEEQLKEVAVKTDESSAIPATLQVRKKKNKNKTDVNVPMAGPSSSSMQMPSTSAAFACTPEHDTTAFMGGSFSMSTLTAQIFAMQDNLNQLVTMQRELQKQIGGIVAVPVVKEVKRMEVALGQRMEKLLKAHVEAMWARIQEDTARRDKLEKERLQQLTSLVSNSINKDLPASLERTLRKELSSMAPSVARLVTPNIEKAIVTAVNDSFQKGIAEKGAAQLEKSVGARIEASLSRQLQAQFQTNGKQALQEGLRTSLEASVIPAFERACQAMFGQVDVAFQKGIAEHRTHAQQQLAASHSALTLTLQEALASASSLASSLKGDLADGQRKLLALVESTGATRATYKPPSGSLFDKVMTVQSVEESLDPTKELTRLIMERKLEEAFNKALSLADVGVVSWLCNQVDPEPVFATTPVPLSQGVILSLVQQLGCDLGNDTSKKLLWIKAACLELNPHDPALAPHMRHFLEKLYGNLHALITTTLNPELVKSTRLVMHVVNSLLTACK